VTDEDIARAKTVSIPGLLSSMGMVESKSGSKSYFQSPFSTDRTASLCVYINTNSFYDWSNGFGGDGIKLIMELERLSFNEAVEYILNGDISTIEKPDIVYEEPDIDVSRFLKTNVDEDLIIRNYALSRGITRNYVSSVFIINSDGNFIRRPSMGFIHLDEEMNECGIKMRDIDPRAKIRFSARGKQKFYVMDNCNRSKDAMMFIVESESSANSLFEFMCILKKNCVVVSFGSWSNVPREMPNYLNHIKDRRFIIDYDGNEELYLERISKFSHLDSKEIKLELDKGDDINSLFVSGKIYKYKNNLIV